MNSLLLVAAITSAGYGSTIRQSTVDTQNEAFQRWWATEFEWRFDKLPKSAGVPAERVPYSGYIYPDTHGGTIRALRKYDQALNQRWRAAAHERRDTSITDVVTRPVTRTRRFFGRVRTITRMETVRGVPHWYGHCNGWTSATIRHAEPRHSVTRNGVTFTPKDIKSLLAEIYIYNDNLNLTDTAYINPGTLHAAITNWLGRGLHPIGMEADPGREKWNYPIYKYSVRAYNRSSRHVDVEMKATYAMNAKTESDKSPKITRVKRFHYHLNLDADGKIVGGYYYRNSARIDLLWIPLSPKKAGTAGNKRGNPYVDIDTVLSIWRESVPAEVRSSWAHVDPAPEDRLPESVTFTHLKPAIVKPVVVAESATGEAATSGSATTFTDSNVAGSGRD